MREIINIETPFRIKTGASGAIIIEPENSVKDPLDLPPERLKRLVKGIIWRDAYFDGKSLRDLAKPGNHSPNYVRRCIYESFEIPVA